VTASVWFASMAIQCEVSRQKMDRFGFPSSFQLRASLGKLSAASPIRMKRNGQFAPVRVPGSSPPHPETWHCGLGLRGSGCILRSVNRQLGVAKSNSLELERAICDAVLFATCFYWKPVLCLQRSVCTARLLRRHGINARLVLGYRASPFFCHAWVEVGGRVAYGSPAYQNRLQPL
jgi:hypothetical protein